MIMTRIKSVLTAVQVIGLAGAGLFMSPVAMAQAEAPKQPPAKEADKPPHFVEKPDMKPQLDTGPSYKIVGEPTEEQILVASKTFIADIRDPGKVRFRELIDPRYLKKYGLTDRDLIYEIGDHVGLENYHVADDLRTVLFVVQSKGGTGRELIIVRWVLYDGHLYLSPEKAPDPVTGIFRPWILQAKLIERK